MSIEFDFKSKLRIARKTGTLTLSNIKNDFTKIFETNEFLSSAKLIHTLNLSYSNIYSVDMVPLLRNATTLKLDHTGIENFKDFLNFPKTSKIFINDTPVANNENFKLALYILFGDQLSSINGKIIQKSVISKAKKYDAIARILINKGWMVVYPPPGEDEMDKICESYGIDRKVETGAETKEEVTIDGNYTTNKEIVETSTNGDFQTQLDRIRNMQNRMHEDGDKMFGLTDDIDDSQFPEELMKLLKEDLNVNTEGITQEGVLDILKQLCQNL